MFRLQPVKPLPAGLYAYKAPLDAPLHYRLHLRLEADGRGVLLVNGSTVLHLNPTAAEYAYHLIQGTPPDEVARQVASRYRVSRQVALKDFNDLAERIQALITTPDLDPVSYLGFERIDPYGGEISAPYRLDCALTYRLLPDVAPDTAPTERVSQELSTGEWKALIDKAWGAGVPHLVFTGGEPTLREDLPELLNRAESNGQVTGLLTDGLRLKDSAYLDRLLQAGLDHVMILLHPEQDQSWESLSSFQYWADVLGADLYVAGHLTITPDNADQTFTVLQRLAETGIHAISLSVSEPGLTDKLEGARQRAAELGLSLVWDLPVPYWRLNPVTFETSADEPQQGAGRGWLYVEPDGDVLPAQGINRILGNLLRDPWEQIWAAANVT